MLKKQLTAIKKHLDFVVLEEEDVKEDAKDGAIGEDEGDGMDEASLKSLDAKKSKPIRVRTSFGTVNKSNATLSHLGPCYARILEAPRCSEAYTTGPP
jgi:hypothetical protein